MRSAIAENLAEVRRRIAAAARNAGRAPEEVTLVAVSKTKPVEALQAAYDAGQRVFGENYVQETIAKIGVLPNDIEWHMIGHLQSNKAKPVAGALQWVQTVDSLRLARALERHARAQETTLSGLIQLNWGREEGKFGMTDEDALRELMAEAADFQGLRIRGLMTIPDPRSGEKELRSHFSELRELRDRLAGAFGLENQFCELSMGMSHDYEWAVAEGATLVRVGTAIFGART